MDYSYKQLLIRNNIEINAILSKYSETEKVETIKVKVPLDQSVSVLNVEGIKWEIRYQITEDRKDKNTFEINVNFKVLEGRAQRVSMGINIHFNRWSKDNYVVMPALVYKGNRFLSKPLPYPPILPIEDRGVDKPCVITDVSRLNCEDGPSIIQAKAGEMATPSIGIQSAQNQTGFWIITEQESNVDQMGIELEESLDRSEADINVVTPLIRPKKEFTWRSSRQDQSCNLSEGEEVAIRLKLFAFSCKDIQGLYDYFSKIRTCMTGNITYQQLYPFSNSWKVHEEKYNRDNWRRDNYYATDTSIDSAINFQIGWVGGLMNTLPLIFQGNELSRKRVCKTLDFAFSNGQGKSGFFYGSSDGLEWFGDDFYNVENKRFHLVRKSADALYFIIKQFMLFEKQNRPEEIKAEWYEKTKILADAFVNNWQKYHQFGQFIDADTGEIIIGGSASAGIAPAGLALAGQYFRNDAYLSVAKASATYYYENFVNEGYTNGGPGEICQCPDSESAFGILESFVVLHEVTEDELWLKRAKEMAHQAITWCVSYDYRFPSESTFGKMKMKTAGSVYANSQNKHSAPGICTLSGDSLFKLYRATGDQLYLEWVKSIAHNVSQYLSRKDRPIVSNWGSHPVEMLAGWMCERVNICDWEGDNKIGEVFNASCWCEISSMLTIIEIPGVYIQIDTGLVYAFDHIDIEVVENTDKQLTVIMTNPTAFEADVKLLVETSFEAKKPLGQNALYGQPIIKISPRSEYQYSVSKEKKKQ